ncbi:MAG: enoyl-CoA hydratase/isomerase [Candidatus Magnetoglobus multicellularis str. Araruama]|uniref:Enoyl-CoA hydratase/isomerase n=1 Tax=Candidatus Magnetoglobus multicellularis str. Araruama TaxID=890399 RepID=A0A1V1NS66_9BACT|nr:MAG: enoyl-CoA hydratase/isomerase [Candidatus Magnetoglobus multicellularis str. Araruama]
MALVEYELDENVAIVTFNDGENRFNPSFLDAVLSVLDDIEQNTEANVLVVKSAHEKIFSNGIDLEWLYPYVQKKDLDTCKSFFYKLNDVFKRVLMYPMPTIAAMNGHSFAGGAILSCAFDFRFMRTGRGFFCFPEVDLGIPFLPGMTALLDKAIPKYKMIEMQLTGVRLPAEECEKHNIIVKACPLEELMTEVLTFAKAQNKRRIVVQELKKVLYKSIVHALDEEDHPLIESGRFNV